MCVQQSNLCVQQSNLCVQQSKLCVQQSKLCVQVSCVASREFNKVNGMLYKSLAKQD